MKAGPKSTILKCPACGVEGPCKCTDTYKSNRRRVCLSCQAIFHTEETAIIYKGKALSTLKALDSNKSRAPALSAKPVAHGRAGLLKSDHEENGVKSDG